MNVSTSRLGIFELVGYLFSGVYVLSAVAVPVALADWAMGWERALSRLDRLGLLEAAFLLVLAYAAGVVFSRPSLWYYEGWGPLFARPVTHPSGPKGRPSKRAVVWAVVDTKVHRARGRLGFDLDDIDSGIAAPGGLRVDVYHSLAYVSPLYGVVDRIAAVTRFASALPPAFLLCLVTTCALEVVVGFGLYGERLAAAWLVVQGGGAVAGHFLSVEYAESYWRYVATAALCSPLGE